MRPGLSPDICRSGNLRPGLGQCQTDLGDTQTALSQTQTDLGVCQINLGEKETALTQALATIDAMRLCLAHYKKENGVRCRDGVDNDCDGLVDGNDPIAAVEGRETRLLILAVTRNKERSTASGGKGALSTLKPPLTIRQPEIRVSHKIGVLKSM